MSATSQFEASVGSRRDPARLSPQRVAKAAYGPFCDALRRLGCLTPTQAEVGRFVAWATLRQGFTSLAFSSLSELTQVRAHARPFAGLGKNDLSPALVALGHFGLIRLETREALETGVPPVTMLTVIADATQWAVPAAGWRYSEAEEGELLEHLLACRQRWTAQLPELAEEADLLDARAAVAAEAAANALEANPEPTLAACRGGSVRGLASDAREVRPERTRGVPPPCRSESRNAESPMFAIGVPKVGTGPLRLKSKDSKELKINLKGCTQAGLKEALLMIELTEDDDQVRAAIIKIVGEEAGQRDAGKWIVRRWNQRAKVHETFCDVVNRLTTTHLPPVRHIGGLAETYWKKSKESFTTP
jgi:hypothetical protein